MNSSPRSVLFLAPEPLRQSLTGPTRRVVKLAEAVAEVCDVTLGAPAPSVFPDGPMRTLETGPERDEQLKLALASHDVTVVQTLPSPRQLLMALRHAPRLVVDVIAPLALEVMEIDTPMPVRRALVRWRTHELAAHLAAADLVLCTNEKQRDLVLGIALASGLLEPGGRPLQERIAVVPHGIDDAPLPSHGSPLRADGLGDDVRIAVWGGGIWSWLDPLTAIRAVERLRPSRPDLRLAFVGLDHPDPEHRRAHEPLAAEAMAYVRDRGLEEAVVFRPRWLSRDEYVGHLMDADVGVSLHGPTLEGLYASRTRVLDYLFAGLPVVCTSGDTMADLVASRGLGVVVEPLDADACATALDRLTQGEPHPVDRQALEPLHWRNVARPLLEFCASPDGRPQRSRRAAFQIVAREYPSFVSALYRTQGGRAAAAALVRRATAGIRRP